MGRLTFAINVTLDGCCDHRETIPDDELMRYYTRLLGAAGGILFGRVVYEMMEEYWPRVAQDAKAPASHRAWAKTLGAKPKYVVSRSRRDFPWNNTRRLAGGLAGAVKALKRRTPRGLLVGSPTLAAELERLGLIDEYRFAVQPIIAGHGPFLFRGLLRPSRLKFLGAKRFKSGVTALRYRRA